jgi:filamentous hemagglutinin family protein
MTVNADLMRAFIVRFTISVAGLLVVDLGAIAQVVPDQTLSSPSLVNASGSTATINGGTTAGTNLFHSFSQFSVPSGATAFFNNDLATNNIITRVTGDSFSLINGTIRANGVANLFLINPNGILFGPNASLNIGGSFVASTANNITFADGFQYSATNPQAVPLLAVNVPVGLQYGKVAQPIIAIGSSLSVKSGKTLALVGGDVSLDGTTLRSPSGRIDLGGALDAGVIGLTFTKNIPSLNFSRDVVRSNISLIDSTLRVAASGGGNIAISAQNIDISDSLLVAGLSSGTGNKGGNITLSASDQITVATSSLYNFVFGGTTGNGGDIEVTAKSLSLSDGTQIRTGLSGKGSGGDINIVSDSLSLIKGAQLRTDNFGIGSAGNINVLALDTIAIDSADGQGSSSAFISNVDKDAQGNGGDVSVFTKSLFLTNDATITSITFGSGNAGNLTVTARDSVSLNGDTSIIFSNSSSTANGNGGDIAVFTKTLKIGNGASISNSTFSQRNSGNISIAADMIDLDGVGLDSGSSIFILTGKESFGNGGEIDISTGALSLTNGAFIGSGSQGKGITGDIVITASDFIRLDGVGPILPSGIFNNPVFVGEGGAGNIMLDTKSLSLTNGAVILALQTGSQKTGNIDIKTTESVNILGASQTGSPSRITSATLTSLPSGDIAINTPILKIVDSGLGAPNSTGISAISNGTGDAGDITINAGTVTIDAGEIAASIGIMSMGDGGSITVTGNTLTALNGGNIRTATSSSRGGDAGNINFYLSDRLSLSGDSTGIFADTEINSTGNGGNIFIDPPIVRIDDGAAISVNSKGSGTGGSIALQAGSLTLDNGTISAATVSNNGGNIKLGVQDLLLANNNSRISATAGGNGNGGNLDINSGFIVLNNNSNIAANAFQGQGGNIQISTQGLFQARDSTITASSQLGINGTVQLNVTDLDPSRGLFSLPETVVDASRLVAQKCDAAVSKESQQSEFVVTGRGGLQPNPGESLQDESILSNWVTLQPHSTQSSERPSVMIAPSAQTINTIAIAQGWKVDSDGTVILTAEPSSVTSAPTWQPSVKCRA